ncbi:hypothetical protein C6501_02415 [Candidatus Poribacteria bacterium]|nr:MAG: hypothetical protein C6501_02415 [Candidatus Poribacteria bacterium]
MLSVVSHELGVTLTQQSVSDKTNEIPVSTEILKAFDVSGKVITTDALLTQRTFCYAIIEREGDYVLPVKDNQPDLLDAIEKLFQGVPDTLSDDTTHPILGEPIHIHETVEKSHGRLETRCLKASTSLNAYLDWPGITQVFQYRWTDKNLNTGEETHKIHYGITSLKPEAASAERLLTLRRGHWSIENKSHWIQYLEKMPPLSDAVLYHKSWQQCGIQHYPYYDLQGIQLSLGQSNISLQNLNLQLTL